MPYYDTASPEGGGFFLQTTEKQGAQLNDSKDPNWRRNPLVTFGL